MTTTSTTNVVPIARQDEPCACGAIIWRVANRAGAPRTRCHGCAPGATTDEVMAALAALQLGHVPAPPSEAEARAVAEAWRDAFVAVLRELGFPPLPRSAARLSWEA